MNALPEYDIVYSWGVLHHTGDMWNAIRNAASKVGSNGLFDIAIYNKQEYRTLKEWRGSHFWLKVKRLYNSGGAPTRWILEGIYRGKEIMTMLLRGKNPITEIEAYGLRRGMSWSIDVTDWIGGLPFEFASVDEIFRFCNHEFGFQLINLESTISLGCNQFLFKRPTG
jgi:2-polyprenyl-6-hydroxyphenyl methylase/3-demethylubiquinone-9 3-methyltransferase